MEGLELVSFKIISAVGMAKSSYIEAMKAANDGDFALAEAKIKEGDESFTGGHSAHGELIQKEASGDHVVPTILLMHAEDQLMSAETIKVMALEIIRLNKRVAALEK
ncbi:MAG: PTS lactose/cellobiose transporter subunit IIA [Thomasclavelia sp.]